ncbi:MAG: hypothetical protein HYZ53_06450 [Planctomycetes bacterium]|nr:hypothetical protein [Planctomycetota bacterium]
MKAGPAMASLDFFFWIVLLPALCLVAAGALGRLLRSMRRAERDGPQPGEEAWRTAALRLGLVGTAHAVEPLLELAARASLERDRGLEAVVQKSLLKIRARLDPGAAGRVSLAPPGDQQGTLSLADADGGLSLAPDGSANNSEAAPPPPDRESDGEATRRP